MSIFDRIKEKARKNPKRIVLPESNDERIKSAIKTIKKEGIAEIIPLKGDMLGKTIEGQKLTDSVHVAAMMVKQGTADGFVAGASHKTADVARAALHCMKVDKSIKVMSGAFVIEAPGSGYGQKGAFVFSDCGIVPFPTKEQLAGIAISAARFAQKILDIKPKVAMLSYSTKGSAATSSLDNIRSAVEAVKRELPGIDVDGELQVDAALDYKAADIKDSIKGSSVSGCANVLIFPNLDSGNIAYKLVQRLAKVRAVGPLLLGLKSPASDLSRACSTDDVIDAVAITSVMAQ